MIVWSVKVKKKPLLWMAVLLAGAVVLVIAAARWGDAQTVSGRPTRAAGTDEERRAFLAAYGWTLAADPVEIRQVVIPEVFNDVYTQYNAMQKAQGCDLTRYRGKTARRWTYEITNYPDAGKRRVYADLLIYNGQVIGGSVGTREADGFMHGFQRPETPEMTAENDK
jgi:hypothetical protein